MKQNTSWQCGCSISLTGNYPILNANNLQRVFSKENVPWNDARGGFREAFCSHLLSCRAPHFNPSNCYLPLPKAKSLLLLLKISLSFWRKVGESSRYERQFGNYINNCTAFTQPLHSAPWEMYSPRKFKARTEALALDTGRSVSVSRLQEQIFPQGGQ